MELVWIIAIIVFVVVVAGVVVAYTLLRRRKNKKRAGVENRAQNAVAAASRFARSNDYKLIAPASLARKGTFAHLDAVVVGYFGVLGVKALGYNGEIYGTSNDSEWLQVAPDGQRSYFKNPIEEASSDVRVIRDALFAAKLKMTPVEVVCVFTDPKAQVAVPKSTGHYTMKTFKDLLEKEKYREDKGLDLDKVEAAIRAAMVQE